MKISPTLHSFVFIFICLCGAKSLAGPTPASDTILLMEHPADVRIALVASEPQIFDPVAMAFDARGNLYVAENRAYPEGPLTGEAPVGSIARLRDINGDGHFEERTDFATGLNFPNGVMAWKEGVIVTDAPNVLYLPDVDNDGHADSIEILLEGFSLGGSTQLRVSHPTFGVDNWIYLTNGLSGGDVIVNAKTGAERIKLGRNNLRYHPKTQALELTGGRAQFGLAFDRFGNQFICSNRNHIQHVVFSPNEARRNPWQDPVSEVHDIPDHGAAAEIFAISGAQTTAYAHAGTFTAACGLTIYRGSALPSPYHNNAFVCEPTANLIHRDQLARSGSSFVATRAHSENEFIASTDTWFRPVFLTDGPDGALYVCDMYRKTIEHPTYLSPEVAAATDFASGRDRGRIYRITSVDGTEPRSVNLANLTTTELCEKLGPAENWIQRTAHRLIHERADAESHAPLRAVLENAQSAVGRLHALRLLEGLDALTADDLDLALEDLNAEVIVHALKIAASREIEINESTLERLLTHKDPIIDFQLALGQLKAEHLAWLAHRNINDPHARAAILGAIIPDPVGFESHFLRMLRRDSEHLPDFLRNLARTLSATHDLADIALPDQLRADAHGLSDHAKMAATLGFIEGGLRTKKFTSDQPLVQLEEIVQSDGAIVRMAAQHAQNGAAEEQRMLAIELLGYADPQTAFPDLLPLLGPQNPQEVRTRAVQSIARLNHPAVAETFLNKSNWRSFSAPMRTHALNALLKSRTRIDTLLDAIEDGEIPAWSINPSTRARLTRSPVDEVKSRALKLLTADRKTDRRKVFEEHLPLLELTADATRGRTVFEKNCATCHTFRGEGHAVGPDLSDISSHPAESILMHILMPNWLMLEGYENYVIETLDGMSYSGLVASESESSITLKAALGQQYVVDRANIESMVTTSLSIMPEEFEQVMSHQEIRDLIAFLRGEKP